MQWLETEELQDPQHAWDGAIVEISTNAGTSFDQITPIGGYPYRIFGHPASAFPDETPCFAGTGGWERVTFNLSAYTGTFVQFRLTFGSDGFVTEEGWYVDDFEVGPFGGQDSWLNMSITHATVSSQGSRNVLLSIDTQDFDYGEVRQSVIRLTSNDPISPEQFVYLGATNVSRVIAVVVTGPGSVTPPGPVVADVGDTVDFLIEADTYHHIASITAGENVYELSFNLPTTNVMWSVMNSSATGHLYVVFAANLVTNGLTELWLAGHGLTNAPFADEALLDRDGDGANALHEFVAGTDPTNRANVLALLLQDVNAGSNAVPSQSILGLRLAWPSAAQRTYSLYSATDMHSGFNLLVSNIVATPPSNVYTSSAPLLSNQLFRIEARFGE